VVPKPPLAPAPLARPRPLPPPQLVDSWSPALAPGPLASCRQPAVASDCGHALAPNWLLRLFGAQICLVAGIKPRLR